MFFFCHFVVTAWPDVKHPNIFVLGDEELNRPPTEACVSLSPAHIVEVRSVPSEEESGKEVSGGRHGFQTLWPFRRSDTNKSNGNVKKRQQAALKTGSCGGALFVSSLLRTLTA